jgi:hypothetical protein
MFRRILMLAATVFLLSSIRPVAAATYWIEDGIRICDVDTTQQVIGAVEDGAGGAIIAWLDYRDPSYTELFAQRLNSRGEELWTEDGVLIAINPYGTTFFRMLPDGSGGAFFSFPAQPIGHPVAARISPEGTLLWQDNVSNESLAHWRAPDLALDGTGGIYVCWAGDDGASYDIYAQRLDGDGNRLWSINGLRIVYLVHDQTDPRITLQGTDAVIVWRDDTNPPGIDLYAQKIDTTGATQWSSSGVPVYTGDVDIENDFQILTTYNGDVVVAWKDDRNGNMDIFAQLLRSSGAAGWTANGLPVCTAAYEQNQIRMIPYGIGGVILVWSDYRDLGSGYQQIYAQYIEGHGVPWWQTDGRTVGSAAASQYGPEILAAGNDAIVAWNDRRSGENDIYMQKIDGDGDPLWQSGGIAVTNTGYQENPFMVTDGSNGAIAAWDDVEYPEHEDVYVKKISSEGEIIGPAPLIRSVLDIPGDEGGYARIDIRPSTRDLAGIPAPQVTLYNVWRRIETSMASVGWPVGDESRAVDSQAPEPDIGNLLALAGDPARKTPLRLSAVEAAAVGLPPGTWESIGLHIAMQQAAYYFTVPTRQDSSQSGAHLETFAVSAHTANPELYFISLADSGYSVDNIAPSPPLSLSGEQSFVPAGLNLTWAPNQANDLWYYGVYRGTDSGFTPGAGNIIATPQEEEWFDGSWAWDAGYWYKVSAVDIHGNESAFAVFSPGMVTGDDPAPVPLETFLGQNFPNPFNPVTAIAFGIREPGHVSLRIYDAAGRLVTTLIDEARPAGRYTTEWTGKSADGTESASGVYFYKLKTMEFEKTRKMILLR